MFNNGHLVHPDIWMLWFSFFVALYVVAKPILKWWWRFIIDE